MHRWRNPAWALLALGVCLAGCSGGSTFVLRRPQWAFESYPRIAVVAAQPADPNAYQASELLADRLTSMLASNGAFEVLSRAELAQVVEEQDLSQLVGMIDGGTALPEGRIKIAQAIVVPKVTQYDLSRRREHHTEPVYARDRRGNVRQVGTRRITVHTHTAEVGASVHVIDAATGRILLSYSPSAIQRKKTGRNQAPTLMPEQLAADAAEMLAITCCGAVAPTRIEVDLSTKMLVLATAYFDGRYDEFKKIAPTTESFLLAIRNLPRECHENNFRVAISAEDGHANLFEKRFTWQDGMGKRGVSYRVPMSALASAGESKFIAKLYNAVDPEPVLEREFELATD